MSKDYVYLICKSYVDNFEVLEVCNDYLESLTELENIKKYSNYIEAEEKYHIYCLEIGRYYNYRDFDLTEVK